ncbi:MAG: DUF378 domain-containing protein [Candidatus Microgenomates bacterium]|jgi:uncharacterized membrane protein YuzA (DUF378 family)
MDGLRTLSKWLVLIGAVNWGLIGLLGVNLVTLLFGTWPFVVSLVYILVGVAGVWGVFAKFTKKRK